MNSVNTILEQQKFVSLIAGRPISDDNIPYSSLPSVVSTPARVDRRHQLPAMDLATQAQWVMNPIAEGEAEDAAFSELMAATPECVRSRKRSDGSYPGRAPNKKRDPHGRHERLLQQYFGPEPMYNDLDFRNRFRMNQSVQYNPQRGYRDRRVLCSASRRYWQTRSLQLAQSDCGATCAGILVCSESYQ